MIKPFIFSQTFELQTSLSQGEALDGLAGALKLMPLARAGGVGDGRFYGTITDNRFRMQRYIRAKQGYEPVISGEILPATQGCTISGIMQMSRWAKTIVYTILTVAVVMISANLLSKHKAESAVLFSLFVVLITSAVMHIQFYYEVLRAKRFLCNTMCVEKRLK